MLAAQPHLPQHDICSSQNLATSTLKGQSVVRFHWKGSLLVGKWNRVAHPLLRLQEIALTVLAATCHVTCVCNSSKDGHVALCPSIAVTPMLW